MAEVASLTLKATTEGATTSTEQLRQLSRAAKESEVSFGGVAKQIVGFTTATQLAIQGGQALLRGIKDMAVESVQLAAGFEKARITWGVLVGDMDKGNQVFNQLRRFAAETPLSFQAVESAAQTLKGFGTETRDLIPTLSRLGDLSHGDSSALGRLALVFGQVQAQGKAMTQDLYQFVNSGVPIFELLSESMGVATGDIKELAAEGAIGFAEIEAAIVKATSAGGDFAGLMDKTAESASGQWSTAVDTWKEQLAALGEAVLPALTAALRAANSAMERWNSLRGAAKAAADEAGFIRLVGRGDEAGVVAALKGMDPETIGRLYSSAQAANPNPTDKQQGALAAAYRAWMQAQANRPGAIIDGTAPAFGTPDDWWNRTTWKNDSAEFVSATFADNLAGGRVPEGTRPPITAGQLENQMLMAEFGGVGAASGPTLNQALETYDELFQVREEIIGQAKEMTGAELAAVEAQNAAAEAFVQNMKAIDSMLQQAGIQLAVDAFRSLGESFYDAEKGAASFAQSMANLAESIIDSLPSMFIQAGLNAIASGNVQVGLGLLAAGGVSGILSGVIDAGQAQSAGAGAAGGGFVPNALGGVYASRSLHSYANGIYDRPQFFALGQPQAFAKGGVFAEAGPEAIMPLRRDSQGRLGVKAEVAPVNVIVNNLAPGVSVEAEERQGLSGREVMLTIKGAVRSMVATGELDSLLVRAGARPAGVR